MTTKQRFQQHFQMLRNGRDDKILQKISDSFSKRTSLTAAQLVDLKTSSKAINKHNFNPHRALSQMPLIHYKY